MYSLFLENKNLNNSTESLHGNQSPGNVNQIDIADRTSSKPTTPTVILFCSNRDMINFFSQGKRIQDLTLEQFKVNNERLTAEEITLSFTSYIYIKESLTQENRRLLKAARIESKKRYY